MADENKALETNETNPAPVDTGSAQGNEQEEVTMDGLMAQLATLKVENARNKAALDKQMKANGELTKQLRAKMTAAEQEAEEKKAREEEQKQLINDLTDFKKRAEAKDRYLLMGMSAEFAKKAADAEVKGEGLGGDAPKGESAIGHRDADGA